MPHSCSRQNHPGATRQLKDTCTVLSGHGCQRPTARRSTGSAADHTLNLGKTTFTLQGLGSLKSLLPSTSIIAQWLSKNMHGACRNNRGKRDLLYAETGAEVRTWYHMPGGRPALTKPRVTTKTLARKPTEHSRSARSAKNSPAGSSEEGSALLCRCIPPAIYVFHSAFMDGLEQRKARNALERQGGGKSGQSQEVETRAASMALFTSGGIIYMPTWTC